MKNTLWILIFSIILQCAGSVFAENYTISEWAKSQITEPLEEFRVDNFQNAISRENFCEIICTIFDKHGIELNISEPLQNPFSDTSNPSVIRLYNVQSDVLTDQKVIYGKNDTTFEPNAYITREEAAAVLFRIYWFLNPNIKLNKRPAVGVFLDNEDIADWAYTDVYIMASEDVEVMIGNGDNYFYPKNNISIEQAIVAVQRLSKLSSNKKETH